MRFTTGLLALALGAADLSVAQNSSADLEAYLAHLELYWSYNRSVPVYPTPIGEGTGEWATPYQKAKALVAQMTNDEKNIITYGYTSTTNGCSGNSGAVPRLNYTGMCLNDAGDGVRGTDGVNGYPSGLHVGAGWDRNLAYNRGQYMGAEFERKGVSVALGPVVGPLGKIAEGGRNWEGFSNDPYLTGSLAAETIRGLQENVIACIKHFVAYEQETNRNPDLLQTIPMNQSISSNVDMKTLHELYVWPFQDAVHAGAGAVMCSYNRINDSYACQNSYTLNGVLKGELGFEGFVVSDWYAQHSGVASANAGLDMAMPESDGFWAVTNLSVAVTNGSVAQSRLDDMATRIVASWYFLEELNSSAVANPGHGMPIDLLAPHEFVNARDPASKTTIFQGAVEGHVLVKNVNSTLPLNKPKFLSLFGYDGPSYVVNTPDNDIWDFGMENTLSWENGTVFTLDDYLLFLYSGNPTGEFAPAVALNGTLISGGGSGSTTPAYVDAPFDAFQRQAYEDDTFLMWDFYDTIPSVDEASEHCIVFINAQSTEGSDRRTLADEYSDNLILNVAAQCNSTIVVIHNAGIRLVDAFVDNENITAIIYAHVPGQDSGRALIEVMYGNQSPTGRLPYTVGKNESDYGPLLGPTLPSADSDYYTQDNFTEGVYIDYKYFIAQNITPQYAFGYGLTYTTFEYSDLSIEKLTNVSFSYLPPNASMAEGGIATLWDVIATVDCTVTNTGNYTAAEVAQLYVGIPGGPAKQLRGYSKQGVDVGDGINFHFDLMRRDLSEWSLAESQWVLQAGTYPIYVGKSVLDIQLTGSLTITN